MDYATLAIDQYNSRLVDYIFFLNMNHCFRGQENLTETTFTLIVFRSLYIFTAMDTVFSAQ